MRIHRLPLVVVSLLATATAMSSASEVDELKDRVTSLEERIASLEKALKPLIAKDEEEQARTSRRLQARMRMRQDANFYSQDELREIESLYQVANKKWGTQEAEQSLRTLVEKYDKANRTGCAILYLGQMTEGEEKIEHLQKAVEKFGDCYYGDGVQVGAYARFLLGQAYLTDESPDKAKKLFDEVRKSFADAIDHRGNLLVAQLPN